MSVLREEVYRVFLFPDLQLAHEELFRANCSPITQLTMFQYCIRCMGASLGPFWVPWWMWVWKAALAGVVAKKRMC